MIHILKVYNSLQQSYNNRNITPITLVYHVHIALYSSSELYFKKMWIIIERSFNRNQSSQSNCHYYLQMRDSIVTNFFIISTSFRSSLSLRFS